MLVNEYLDIMFQFIGEIPDNYQWIYQLFLLVFPFSFFMSLWRCIHE